VVLKKEEEDDNRYLVQYDCCGDTGSVLKATILFREDRGVTLCPVCTRRKTLAERRAKRRDEGYLPPERERRGPKIEPPEWPVPPSLVGVPYVFR
jgi:hypothetical protein